MGPLITPTLITPTLITPSDRIYVAGHRGMAGSSVTCWGTGTPLREFLHVDDLGEACVFALEHWDPAAAGAPRATGLAGEDLGLLVHLNVGTGVDLSIRALAEQVAQATGFAGTIRWDGSKPDGTPKKQLDVSRLADLGWRARIPLVEGLASTVAEFAEQLNHQHNGSGDQPAAPCGIRATALRTGHSCCGSDLLNDTPPPKRAPPSL